MAARPATFQCVSAGSRASRHTGRLPPGSSDLSRPRGEHSGRQPIDSVRGPRPARGAETVGTFSDGRCAAGPADPGGSGRGRRTGQRTPSPVSWEYICPRYGAGAYGSTWRAGRAAGLQAPRVPTSVRTRGARGDHGHRHLGQTRYRQSVDPPVDCQIRSPTGISASPVGRILADLDLKPHHPARGSLTRSRSTRCCTSTPKPAQTEWSQINFLPRWSHSLLPRWSPKDPNITRCPGMRHDQASSSPPSTVSTWPVSQAVCASASRRIHSATSSGSPRRPNGMRAASASLS